MKQQRLKKKAIPSCFEVNKQTSDATKACNLKRSAPDDITVLSRKAFKLHNYAKPYPDEDDEQTAGPSTVIEMQALNNEKNDDESKRKFEAATKTKVIKS